MSKEGLHCNIMSVKLERSEQFSKNFTFVSDRYFGWLGFIIQPNLRPSIKYHELCLGWCFECMFTILLIVSYASHKNLNGLSSRRN